jgi:hypothetical protein
MSDSQPELTAEEREALNRALTFANPHLEGDGPTLLTFHNGWLAARNFYRPASPGGEEGQEREQITHKERAAYWLAFSESVAAREPHLLAAENVAHEVAIEAGLPDDFDAVRQVALAVLAVAEHRAAKPAAAGGEEREAREALDKIVNGPVWNMLIGACSKRECSIGRPCIELGTPNKETYEEGVRDLQAARRALAAPSIADERKTDDPA